MIEFGGWQFPDGEQHLIDHMGRANDFVEGRLGYQYHKLLLALGHTRQRRLALDIGGHIGLWSYHLARLFDHVHAFEPMAEHADCFGANVTATNVTLHRVALGAKFGEASMVVYPGNSGHSHVGEGDARAPMLTLDSFSFENVDFIKIDCEGYERQVLAGAAMTLQRCKPTIIVEQKPGNGSRYGYGDHAALRLLEEMGAKIVAKKAGDYVLVWA